MRYLLDTNVVAELSTKPRPDPAVVAWSRSVPAHSLFISVVTLGEIACGVQGVSDEDRKVRFARALEVLRENYRDRTAGIGEAEATAYLTLHNRLKSEGRSIDPPDALVAAVALARGWTLVSRNVKHLARTGALMLNPWEHSPGD